MEIVNKNVAFLTNCEVNQLLKKTREDLKAKIAKKKNIQIDQLNLNIDKHLSTVVYESLEYLKETPCAHQTPEVINNFLRKCEEKKKVFNLTKVEKIQLINLRPSNPVELQYIIEDSEERFTIEQMDELLEFVMTNLPVEETNLNESEPVDQDN